MYFEKRKQKILEMLQSNESISTVELTKIFDVSEITIRRDLGKLQSMGLVQRVHGGVIGTSIENRMELLLRKMQDKFGGEETYCTKSV